MSRSGLKSAPMDQLARGQQQQQETEKDHDGTNERRKIGIDVLNADLGEYGRECREYGGQDGP